MKILFYGNCQAEAVATALRFSNEGHQIDYAGNSNRVEHFDPDRSQGLMEACDHLITQPIMNTDNPDSVSRIRERFGDRVSFMPYIFVDGLFSLVQSGNMTRYLTGIIGEKYIIDDLQTRSVNEVKRRFQEGEIDFEHKARFARNIAYMKHREKHCRFKVAERIASTALQRPLFISHNHPRPELINHIARQVASHLSLDFTPVTRDDPLRLAAITLPRTPRVVSPYTTAELGASFAYDLHWQAEGRALINQIAGALRAQSSGGKVQNLLAVARRVLPRR